MIVTGFKSRGVAACGTRCESQLLLLCCSSHLLLLFCGWTCTMHGRRLCIIQHVCWKCMPKEGEIVNPMSVSCVGVNCRLRIWPSGFLNKMACVAVCCKADLSPCLIKLQVKQAFGRSRWPCRQWLTSAVAWLLGSRVGIPLRAWMFVCYVYCVLCG